MKQNTKSQECRNAIILSLFLFQYSFIIPLMQYVNPTILVSSSGVLLLGASFFVNRNIYLSRRNLLTFIFIFFLLFLKIAFDESEVEILAYFCAIVGPCLVISSAPFDREQFLSSSVWLALINFLLLASMPFVGKNDYMRFGYGMLPTSVFLYFEIFYLKTFTGKAKIITISVFLLATLEIVIYGARGCLFSFLLCIFLDCFLVHRKYLGRKFLILVGCVTLVMNIYAILSLMQNFINKYNINSYAFKKYELQMEKGWSSASSGRDSLYLLALMKIKTHPFFGNPMHVEDGNAIYVHNLFLQVFQDLGVFVLILLVFLLLSMVHGMMSPKNNESDKYVLSVFFALALGRLMFSSTLWKRPEFWMLLFIFPQLFHNYPKRRLTCEGVSSWSV